MNRNALLLGCLALGGLLLGLVLARFLERPGASPRGAPRQEAPAVDDERLGDSLTRLEAAIAELSRVLEQASLPVPAEPRARAPAGEAAPSELARVTDALENVATLLARQVANRPAGTSSPSGGQPLVPIRVDRGAAFDRLDMRAALASGDDRAWELAYRDLQLRHLFWSAQQVLDVYGTPDEISNSGGSISWYYEYRLPGGERESLSIEFVQGLVSQVDFDHDDS